MQFIASLDIGTTTIRCHIIDSNGQEVSAANGQITLLYPEPGFVEINPDELWENTVCVIRECIKSAGLQATDIKCLAISTQRCTFLTWDRYTGKYFHNFITWKDIRADSLVKKHNSSFPIKCLRAGAKFLYMVTRNKRFLAGSVLKLMNAQVICRLEWVLQNVLGVREAGEKGKAVFGTLDTWLIYKLTKSELHVTDVSCASATGMFDPFTMCWADWALFLFSIPYQMLPYVCDSAGEHFGHTDIDILGASIPIRARGTMIQKFITTDYELKAVCMADQSASLYGSCCFKEGDTKVTMGTGTFLDVNTGCKPHASVAGLYPVVGWRVRNELVYIAEGSSYDTGCLVQWMQQIGLIKDPSESSDIAYSVPSSDGVYFIPAFSGLQAPINDSQAVTGFLGIKPTTKSQHLVRAVLESIAFRVAQLYLVLKEESNFTSLRIRVDGGVSNNDFTVQLLSNLTGTIAERPLNKEMSVYGAAFLAGLVSDVWKDKSQLISLRKIEREFKPVMEEAQEVHCHLEEWNRAVQRFLSWHKPE